MNSYRLSFSTGGLNLQESLEIARMYQELGDWKEVAKQAAGTNLLQSRTLATSTRSVREIVFRLQNLSEEEFEILLDGSSEEQKYLLWVAICRTYPFIAEFASEVLRESYLALKGELTYEDFDYFFNKKAGQLSELEELSESTRAKLRQVLFRMMREANILTNSNIIIPAMFTPALVHALTEKSESEMHFFPVYDQDIKGLAL